MKKFPRKEIPILIFALVSCVFAVILLCMRLSSPPLADEVVGVEVYAPTASINSEAKRWQEVLNRYQSHKDSGYYSEIRVVTQQGEEIIIDQFNSISTIGEHIYVSCFTSDNSYVEFPADGMILQGKVSKNKLTLGG